MKTLTTSQLKTKLSAIANANSTENMTTVITHCVYNGLIHNNIMPEHMKVIRNSNAPQQFKAALSKHMPMAWNKEKDSYEFNKVKAEKLLLELGLEFRESSLDEVAASLPELFAKKEHTTTQFNLDTYVANIAKKLAKEGYDNADEIAAITAMLARNPALVSKVADVVVADADVVSDKVA